MDKDRLIEIQKYWGIVDYLCRECGQVTPVEDIEPNFVAGNQSYEVRCDCGKFLCYLKQAKSLRIFKNIKEGMVDIEKIDRGWLKWALSVNHTQLRSAEKRSAAVRRIESVDKNPTPDYRLTDTDKKRMSLLKRVPYLEAEIKRITVERYRLTAGTEEMSYSEIEIIKKQSKAIGLILSKLGQEKFSSLQWLVDNEIILDET